ncbi:hypothetical protein COP1_014736 [Malus domestica]
MELLGSKTVQEVLIQMEQVPEKYIHKVEDGGVQVPDASAAQLMDVPVIDLAVLAASSISVNELEKLRSSLATWGCFQVINHGMSPEFLDEVREIAKQFCALPMEDKKKYLRQVNDIQGYGNDMGNNWHAESMNQNRWYGVGANDASQFSYGTAVCIEHALDWGSGSGEMSFLTKSTVSSRSNKGY